MHNRQFPVPLQLSPRFSNAEDARYNPEPVLHYCSRTFDLVVTDWKPVDGNSTFVTFIFSRLDARIPGSKV